MTDSANDFELSADAISLGQRMLASDLGRTVTLDELRFDKYSSYWREMLAVVHRHWGTGEGEIIAIIDSGCATNLSEHYNVDAAKSFDLTGEGIDDPLGHGTAISALIHLIAPNASQYHAKLFNAQGKIPGRSYDDKVAQIKEAFDRIAEIGATIVNVSWNYLTRIGQHLVNVRPELLCQCPICEVATAYVQRTDIDVFVAEGNYVYGSNYSAGVARPEGAWSCPSAARLVVPVLGYAQGQSRYSTNLNTTCAIPAPVEIQLPPPYGKLNSLVARFLPRYKIAGSSFATPLVVGTYAAVRSAFRQGGHASLSLPRPWGINEQDTTPYNFPLDLFFVPPDDPMYSSQHSDWKGLVYMMLIHIMPKLLNRNEYSNAGELCCLVGDLLAVPYTRMEEMKLNCWPPMGAWVLEFYLKGIALLHQSPMAMTATGYIQKAYEILQLIRRRGPQMPEVESWIRELEAYHGQHLIDFMIRFDSLS